MSVLFKCPACEMGEHDKHVEHWDKAPFGVLGGSFCPCEGDCTPPRLPLFGVNAEQDQISLAMEAKLDGINRILDITMSVTQRAILAVYLETSVPPTPEKREMHYLRKPKTK